MTDALARQLDELLECHELVKVKVLENSFLTPRGASDDLCARLCAEPVQVIGAKFILYRPSSDQDKRRIVLEK